MQASTVPRTMTPALLAFCRTISPERPTFVRSRPSADAEASACFDNVARKVGRAGGSIAYGWAVWHVPGLYFEAEHHGVWRNRRGELVDVSPQLGGVAKLLFLPDPAAVYDRARFRPNVIEVAGDDPLAMEFVDLSRSRYRIVDAYRSEYTLAMIGPRDQRELDTIDRRLKEIWAVRGLAL